MVHAIWQTFPEIESELVKVRQLILDELHLKIPEIAVKVQDYINAPGKYIRAGLCLQFAQLTPEGITPQKRYIAAALEVLHLATLIHDDVIDEAVTRRGIEAMHIQQSNRIAVYAGDYLVTYSLRLFAKGYTHKSHNPLNGWVLESILIGELNQLANQYRIDMTMYDYLRQIRGKTALLFAAACFLGFYSLNQSARKNKQAFYIGQAMGMAFQLTDDLIDYRVDETDSGKPRLQDVQNGIYTAPLIMAMVERPDIRSALKQRDEFWTQVELESLYQSMIEERVFERTQILATEYTQKALKRLKQLGSTVATAEIARLFEMTLQRIG